MPSFLIRVQWGGNSGKKKHGFGFMVVKKPPKIYHRETSQTYRFITHVPRLFSIQSILQTFKPSKTLPKKLHIGNLLYGTLPKTNRKCAPSKMDGKGRGYPDFILGQTAFDSKTFAATWRIIPFSKWLTTMVSKSPQ